MEFDLQNLMASLSGVMIEIEDSVRHIYFFTIQDAGAKYLFNMRVSFEAYLKTVYHAIIFK